MKTHKILVSSCLLGETVRYDGRNKLLENEILRQWIIQDRIISFCPEVAAGLTVPRIAAEISGGDGKNVLRGTGRVIDKSGHNVTDAFISGAMQALSLCKQFNIKIAILARRSPSCGNTTIYDGSFTGTTIKGAGVTAALLKQNEIHVFNQSELLEAETYLNTLT